jgi:hypothetical protein
LLSVSLTLGRALDIDTMTHSSADLAMAAEQQQRITIAFLVVSWIFILLRIWTRTCIIRSFGWDDAVMLLAGVGFCHHCQVIIN